MLNELKNLALSRGARKGSSQGLKAFGALSLIVCSALHWLHSQAGLPDVVATSGSRLILSWPTPRRGKGMLASQLDSAKVVRLILMGSDWAS